jgi:hypothetical protein
LSISSVSPFVRAIALKSMLVVAKKMIGTSRPSGEYDASMFAWSPCKFPYRPFSRTSFKLPVFFPGAAAWAAANFVDGWAAFAAATAPEEGVIP